MNLKGVPLCGPLDQSELESPKNYIILLMFPYKSPSRTVFGNFVAQLLSSLSIFPLTLICSNVNDTARNLKVFNNLTGLLAGSLHAGISNIFCQVKTQRGSLSGIYAIAL